MGEQGTTTDVEIGELVAAFWRAAAVISGSDRYPALTAPNTRAADTLLRLASLDAESALREILRANLDRDEATWTVACFEIGCVAPAGVHQVGSACDALTSLVSCHEPSHVASELICSAPDGVQWVAVVRSDRRFTFQFPDLGNVAAPDPTMATLAVTRWRRHVSFREACLFVDELPGQDERTEAIRPGPDELPGQGRIDFASDVPGPALAPRFDPGPTPMPISARQAPIPAVAGAAPRRVTTNNDGRRALRKAAAHADASTVDQAIRASGDQVTNQTLTVAMRHAVAEVVPFLEKYLLDAVAKAVATAPGAPSRASDDGTPTKELKDLIHDLPEMVVDELRPVLRRRTQTSQLEAMSDEILDAMRTELRSLRSSLTPTSLSHFPAAPFSAWTPPQDAGPGGRSVDELAGDVAALKAELDEATALLREIRAGLFS